MYLAQREADLHNDWYDTMYMMIIMIISLDTASELQASEDASHPQVVGQQQTLQLLTWAFIVYIRLVYCTYFFSSPICFLLGAEGKYSYAVYLGVAILIIILC